MMNPLRNDRLRTTVKSILIVHRSTFWTNYFTLGGMASFVPLFIHSLLKSFSQLRRMDVFYPPYPALVPGLPGIRVHKDLNQAGPDGRMMVDELDSLVQEAPPDLVFMLGDRMFKAHSYDVEDVVHPRLPRTPCVCSLKEFYVPCHWYETEPGPVYLENWGSPRAVVPTIIPALASSIRTPVPVKDQVKFTLTTLGLSLPTPSFPMISAGKASRRKISRFLNTCGASGSRRPLILVNPHGRIYSQWYIPQFWAKLIAILIDRGAHIVLRSAERSWRGRQTLKSLEDGREAERIRTSRILSQLTEAAKRRISVFEPEDLSETIALIEHPRLNGIVSCQTGIGHIALELEKTTLIFSGDDDYWLPRQEEYPWMHILPGFHPESRREEDEQEALLAAAEKRLTTILDFQSK